MKAEEYSYIDTNFEKLIGFPPRQFQRETIAKILDSQNVLLRAPTGSGENRNCDRPLPLRQNTQPRLPQQIDLCRPLKNFG